MKTALAIALLAVAVTAVAKPNSLLRNGSFETMDARGKPEGWSFKQHAGVRAYEFKLDDSAADLSGERDIDAGYMFEKMALTKPSKAANQILAAVEKNKRRALIGPDAKVFDLVSRLPAGFYQRLLINGAKRQRK